MGGKRVNLDEDQVLKLAEIGMTHKEIAHFFGCSVTTITNRYSGIIRNGHSVMKEGLRRQQLRTAMSGNPTLLIWLGKQMLGQTDVQKIEQTTNVNYTETRNKLEQFLLDGKVSEPTEDADDDAKVH